MTDQVECNCAWNPDSHAETCPVYMQQQIKALRAEIEELDALRNRQSDLLSQTAIAVRGPEPALTRYSHADVPSRVKVVVGELDAALRMVQRLTTACSLEAYGAALHDAREMLGATRAEQALAPENQRVVPVEPLLAEPHPFELLAADHKGMRVDYSGLLKQSVCALRRGVKEPGLAEMLRQLQVHMTELGRRWYSGDTAVVDELLQLYAVEDGARDTLKQQGSAQTKTAPVNRIPAGLYAELEALRTLRDATGVYLQSYMRDEIEDEESCSADQHDSACTVKLALDKARALEWKGGDK